MSGWQDDTRFTSALQQVLRHEGGLVDHAADPGGVTNFGISLRWLASLGLSDGDIDRDGDIDADDVRGMTVEKAAALYFRHFWQPHHYGQMPVVIGSKAFDLAVVMGPRQANRLLQRALSAVEGDGGHRVRLHDDGVIGNQTLAAIAVRSDSAAAWGVRVALRSHAEGFLRHLAAVDPARAVFLDGWISRAGW